MILSKINKRVYLDRCTETQKIDRFEEAYSSCFSVLAFMNSGLTSVKIDFCIALPWDACSLWHRPVTFSVVTNAVCRHSVKGEILILTNCGTLIHVTFSFSLLFPPFWNISSSWQVIAYRIAVLKLRLKLCYIWQLNSFQPFPRIKFSGQSDQLGVGQVSALISLHRSGCFNSHWQPWTEHLQKASCCSSIGSFRHTARHLEFGPTWFVRPPQSTDISSFSILSGQPDKLPVSPLVGSLVGGGDSWHSFGSIKSHEARSLKLTLGLQADLPIPSNWVASWGSSVVIVCAVGSGVSISNPPISIPMSVPKLIPPPISSVLSMWWHRHWAKPNPLSPHLILHCWSWFRGKTQGPASS